MATAAKNTTVKRRRRRRRVKKDNSLYFIMLFIFAAIILLILVKTVLFKVNEFEVTGNSIYSKAEILGSADLSTGKCMFNINVSKTCKKVVKELVYVDKITIRRKLPDKVIITVEEAEPFACCMYEGSRYAVISYSGRYLETEQPFPREGLLKIYGLDLIDVALGSEVKSSDDNKLNVISSILESAENIGFDKIEYIDITNRTDIVIGYDGRIDIEFGSWLDYEYKLKYIQAIINALDESETGKIIYHSAAAGASFITSEDLLLMEEDMRERQEAQDRLNASNDLE